MRRILLALALAAAASLATNSPSQATGPTLTITSPGAGSILNGVVQTTATASDPDGILKVRFWAGSVYLGYDHSAPYSRPWDTRLSPNGQLTLKSEAIDLLGNSTFASVNVTVNNADAVAPAVSIDAPAAGQPVAGFVTLAATASDNLAVQKVRFWAGPTYLGYDSTPPYEKQWDSSQRANVATTVRVEALDNAGNSAWASISVLVANTDAVPPDVSMLAPAEGQITSGIVNMAAAASDDVAIWKVRFWADSVYLGYDDVAPYAKPWDTTATTNGPHVLKLEALDNAGNSTIVTRNVAVDNTPLGHRGVVPWAVEEETASAATSGDVIVLKYDSSGGGWFGFATMRTDGVGASDYEQAAKYGSSLVVCSEGSLRCETTACPGTYPSACAETSPECDGPDCAPKTGNMVGPTRDAVDHRMSNTTTSCDTFAEAFAGPDIDGNYTVTLACDPAGAGACATLTSQCSRRIVVLPIVASFESGSTAPFTITAFRLFYIEGYGSGGCAGSSCEVEGRFVNAPFP